MSLSTLISNLKQFKQDLPELILRASEGLANDVISKIVNRTQIQGKNTAGRNLKSSGGPYTVQYKKFKSKKGRQTTFTDLTFTGEMLRSIGLISKSVSGDIVTLVIAPSKNRINGSGKFGNSDIMDVQEKRYGQIMELSKKEAEELEGDLIKIIERKLNQILV